MADLHREPWTTAPYVLCDHCDRETLVDEAVELRLDTEVTCTHCGALLRVAEVQQIQNTRCIVVRLPDGVLFDDDEETPLEWKPHKPKVLG